MNPFRILREWRDTRELANRLIDKELGETLRQAAVEAEERANAISVPHEIIKSAFGLSNRSGSRTPGFHLIGIIQDAAGLRPKPLIKEYRETGFYPSTNLGDAGSGSGGTYYVREGVSALEYHLSNVRGDSKDLPRANAILTFSYYDQRSQLRPSDLKRFPRYVRRAARRGLNVKYPNLQFAALVHNRFKEVPVGKPDRTGYRGTTLAPGSIHLCIIGELNSDGSLIAVRRIVRHGQQRALTRDNINAALEDAAKMCGGRGPHSVRTGRHNLSWGNG